MSEYKLTEYSHGAGCGCKLSPGDLSDIIGSAKDNYKFDNLIVGNDTKDDAAVIDLDGQMAIVSTTDFFMPIVDDPFDFGAIAATNAISDIYAMGGKPIVAVAILGWPIDKIPASVAGIVMQGAKKICKEAEIPLAGGHSIDAPEPIFGLAVTGKVSSHQVKKNKDGRVGDLLYLTKPLGVGMVTTAQKRKKADPEDLIVAKDSMTTLNKIGQELGSLNFVHAMTDVTGFGLGGHLLEICEAGNISAEIQMDKIPIFDFVQKYIDLKCIPGGTTRNWKNYGDKIDVNSSDHSLILADPQTSGGLLISIDADRKIEFESFMSVKGLHLEPIGKLVHQNSGKNTVSVL